MEVVERVELSSIRNFLSEVAATVLIASIRFGDCISGGSDCVEAQCACISMPQWWGRSLGGAL